LVGSNVVKKQQIILNIFKKRLTSDIYTCIITLLIKFIREEKIFMLVCLKPLSMQHGSEYRSNWSDIATPFTLGFCEEGYDG
jgi:hypothetical protein